MVSNENYDAKEAEPRLQKFWESEKVYKFDAKSKKPVFSIDTPPPTVSGKMHMGHAFSYSQMDFIARYKRMKGFNLFYPFGTDDNGLPTERLVEKERKVRAANMERQEFVKICLDALEKEFRPKYIKNWKDIGMSCDFSLFYTTINEHCRRISQKSFLDLYKDGREYQKEAPSIWCPECTTAIAQAELEDKELKSYFNDIKFKLKDGEDIVIGTTRPEMLAACVAIFVHPKDKKNKSLIGKTVIVPIFNNEVKIIADERVDIEKGTGIVMCCTFGDLTDTEWYKAYKLPLKIVISKDGKIINSGRYNDMSIQEARKTIIEDLKERGLLVSQKEITHIVNVHERCGTEIEILETKQWFIRYLDLKKLFLNEGNKLNWYPGHMKVRYDNWIKGLQWDWCISRQRYFGIPFPVWYCKNCNEVILADERDLPVDPMYDKPRIKKCPRCSSNEFIPEKDVLDTWATSSLTPQIAVQLVKDEKIRKKIFPMSLRAQAQDIITFWLFNTLVKSQLHFKKNPWKDVMISGWGLDPKGRKMSKSKGNIIEPQEVMKKYSADCLRFWTAGSKLGDNLAFQEKELIACQKITIKLWNASKFAFMHLDDFKIQKPKKILTLDKCQLFQLNKLIKTCTESFESYEYSKVKLEVEKFFWHTFCDNYLEIVKDRLYNPDKRGKDARISAQYTLYTSLLTLVKLISPILPYITEELYQKHFLKYEKIRSIHVSEWPSIGPVDSKLCKKYEEFIQLISEIRMHKNNNKKSLKEKIDVVLPVKYKKYEKDLIEDFKAVTSTENLSFGKVLEIRFKDG